MSIPDVPLKLTIDPDEMTLDELEVFEPGGFSVKGFKRFMAAHSSWNAAQVGTLKVSEMKTVAEQLSQALEAASVPKAS